MIELKNIENKLDFKCEVEGYQFPENSSDDWCNLKVGVRQNGLVFEKVDPALETLEVEILYDWFKCLSENSLPRFAELTFTEPCISFNFLAFQHNKVRISIELDHELKPGFEIEQFGELDQDWQMVFELTDVDFKEILSGLSLTMKQYPVRGEQ